MFLLMHETTFSKKFQEFALVRKILESGVRAMAFIISPLQL